MFPTPSAFQKITVIHSHEVKIGPWKYIYTCNCICSTNIDEITI